MAKKKPDEDAWMWMSHPVIPGSISTSVMRPRRGTTISSIGSGLSVKEQALFWFQQQSLAGGMFPAFLYYGQVGLADPKIVGEAAGYSKLLGVSKEAGFAFALILGFTVAGVLGIAIDPAHQWEGGLDETSDYQETQRAWAELDAGFLMPWKETYVPLM